MGTIAKIISVCTTPGPRPEVSALDPVLCLQIANQDIPTQGNESTPTTRREMLAILHALDTRRIGQSSFMSHRFLPCYKHITSCDRWQEKIFPFCLRR